MPASKPISLHTRHNTKAEIEERLQAEAALHLERKLPANEPSDLKGNKIAAAVWRRLMREFNSLDAELVSRLDYDLLIDYCVVMGQVEELDAMRDSSVLVWQNLLEEYERLISEGDIISAKKLTKSISASHEIILKVDARTDAKRKLAFSYRQSLFMTPRSRTGVKPPEDSQNKIPDDPLEAAFAQALEKKSKEVANRVDGDSGEGT